MRWAVLGLSLLLFGCSVAGEVPAGAPAAPVKFTDADRQLIQDFYVQYEFPPGAANPSLLAPDLETRLEATGDIPPGLAAMPLPVELEKILSPLPAGYVRFRVGSAVVMMDARTREVVDQVQVSFR